MSNYEAFRQRELDSALYTVPDNAMRNGDFSELLPGGSACVQQQQCFTLHEPFSDTPIQGNIIPQSRLDPIAQKLLAIGFHLAGFDRVVERGVQGVDVDAVGNPGERYATEVKTTQKEAVHLPSPSA